MTVERRLFRLGHGATLHYREGGREQRGAKPTLVLLHPSPRSSAMYVPWMKSLTPHLHVIALDTPGYGGSDALPQAPTSLADYLPTLHEFLQAVAGPRPVIYGSATGAQLGIAYALIHPSALAHLVLDNAAHFDEAAHAHIVARYFPDLTPRDDGSHLAAAWQMCAGMLEFFPWFERDEAHRIAPRAPTAAEVQAAFSELIAAGPGYAAAYRAAFAHERAEKVQALTVPTTLLRWQGSILLPHIERLCSFALPANVAVLDIPAPLSERYAAMSTHLLSLG
jgi:pimeloyl-ACP methyl ester carboxylesterase